MTSPQHYLAVRPCIELLTIGGEAAGQAVSAAGQTLFIPAGGTAASTFFPTTNLSILRLSDHLELHQAQSKTTSFLLLLTSGGLIVYLLYKSLNEEEGSGNVLQNQQQSKSQRLQFHQQPQRQRWSAQNWLRWLFFGDTNDLRGQYFGPIQPFPSISSTKSGDKSHNNAKNRLKNSGNHVVYVSPCPNCVRGVCKIKKHHQLLYHRSQYVPILESASTSGASTPVRPITASLIDPYIFRRGDWSADDESSGDDRSLLSFVKESPSRRKKSSRIPPEGRDNLLNNQPQKIYKMARDDESMESIAGVDGSMVDLVKGAREVRRLIREASFDSLASEFSLDLQNDLGGQTAYQFDSINDEISWLRDNCESMGENIEIKENVLLHQQHSRMKSSKSEQSFSKESTPASMTSQNSLSSSPDLRNLHKIIHSGPARNKALWTLTHNTGFSDNDSNYSPIHRDPSFKDIRNASYKVVLSSNTSECGDWEWDSEGLTAEFMNPDFVPEHETWLQDDVLELDLEAELLTSTFAQRRRGSSQSSACGSDLDTSNMFGKVRLPPSGRSSAMSNSIRENPDYPDLKALTSMTFSRSSSTSSLKGLDSSGYFYHPRKSSLDRSTGNLNRKSFGGSSDESGIEDKSMDYSMTSSSMKSSVTTPLSPVHEAKESPNKSPCSSSTCHMEPRKGHKARRRIQQ